MSEEKLQEYQTLYDFAWRASVGKQTVVIDGENILATIYDVGKFTFSSQEQVDELFAEVCVDDGLQIVRGTQITIEEGVIFIPSSRCNGLVICCSSLVNKGKIVMTDKGSANVGQDLTLLYSEGEKQYVPALGGYGGAKVSVSGRFKNKKGNYGEKSLIKRGTGGGGSGQVITGKNASSKAYSGDGSQGRSFGSGSGGGAASSWGHSVWAGNAGISGGNGACLSGSHGSNFNWHWAGGGAGAPGGLYATWWTNASGPSNYRNPGGIAGLIVIFAVRLINEGIIESNGSAGGLALSGNGYRSCGGGSGGGSINIFCNLLERGSISAVGGNWGGEGSICIDEFLSELFICKDKDLLTYNGDWNLI